MNSSKLFISRKGLKELDNYKYKSGASTWLDKKMNPFWQFCAAYLPERMAPNMVTFVGWILVITSYVLMLFYDYTFSKNIPSYCFFLAALFIFTYMNLDAMDGKQARKLKLSSPLGQLFDHGCDSFSMTFFVLAICQATKLESTQVFLVTVASQLGFFTANWMEYNTGVLQTNVGQFGVTQMEFSCIFIHLLTGIFGQNLWGVQINQIIPRSVIKGNPQMNWLWDEQIKNIIVYVFAAIAFLNLIRVYVSTILKSSNKFQVAAQFLPLYMIIIMEFIWFNYLSIYETYRGIILVNFGVLLSFLICKMIICSVTKMKFQYLHKQFIVFIVTTLLMVVTDFMGQEKGLKKKQVKGISIWLFWICFAINLYSILRFLARTINQITRYLGIYCFTVDKRQRKLD